MFAKCSQCVASFSFGSLLAFHDLRGLLTSYTSLCVYLSECVRVLIAMTLSSSYAFDFYVDPFDLFCSHATQGIKKSKYTIYSNEMGNKKNVMEKKHTHKQTGEKDREQMNTQYARVTPFKNKK